MQSRSIILCATSILFLISCNEINNEIQNEVNNKSSWEIGILQRKSKGILIEEKEIIIGRLEAQSTNNLEEKINLNVFIKENGNPFEIRLPNKIEENEDTSKVTLFYYQEAELRLFLPNDSSININSALLNRMWIDSTGIILKNVLNYESPTNVELTLFEKNKIEEQLYFEINPLGLKEKIEKINPANK